MTMKTGKTIPQTTPKMKSTSRDTQLSRGIKHGYRSGLEESVADAYVESGVAAHFEPIRIPYQKKPATYLVDFVQPNGIAVETKGRFLSQDRAKHLLIRKQHPELDIRFVFSNSRQKLSKNSKTTYAMWCDRHKFKYADRRVPQEWLDEPIKPGSVRAFVALGLSSDIFKDES